MTPQHNSHMYYVYLIQSKTTGKLYTGYTSDLRARLHQHNTGKSIATKAYMPYELIYYEAYKAKKDAIVREQNLKYYGQGIRRLKERLNESIKYASYVRGKTPAHVSSCTGG
jgi:putative endonuclease